MTIRHDAQGNYHGALPATHACAARIGKTGLQSAVDSGTQRVQCVPVVGIILYSLRNRLPDAGVFPLHVFKAILNRLCNFLRNRIVCCVRILDVILNGDTGFTGNGRRCLWLPGCFLRWCGRCLRTAGSFTECLQCQRNGPPRQRQFVTVRVGGYGILNVRGSYELGRGLSLEGRIDNLLDKNYQTVDTYNTPGRSLFVTLRYAADG